MTLRFSHFRSTAQLESFHNVILKYASKRQSYLHRTYKARCRGTNYSHDDNSHLARYAWSEIGNSRQWYRWPNGHWCSPQDFSVIYTSLAVWPVRWTEEGGRGERGGVRMRGPPTPLSLPSPLSPSPFPLPLPHRVQRCPEGHTRRKNINKMVAKFD